MTVDGLIQITSVAGCDMEACERASTPQNCSVIDRPPIEVERSYRTFVTGLPLAIRKRVRRESGVIAR